MAEFPPFSKIPQVYAHAISTPVFKIEPNQDPIYAWVEEHGMPHLRPGRILAITSKLFSISERRIGLRSQGSKKQWIEREADQVLGTTLHDVVLTVKQGVLLPTAGIDESNSELGEFLLLPQHPYQSLQKLHSYLSAKLGYSNFGLIMTDSRTQPLRVGVMGFALAHFGFLPTRDKRGTPDLFGRQLKVTEINDADPLAAIAVMLMGESNESQPMAILDVPWLQFELGGSPNQIQIPVERDLYGAALFQPSK
jgi:F420-0:gamma-glutamyl ligase